MLAPYDLGERGMEGYVGGLLGELGWENSGSVSQHHLRLASDHLDEQGPFIGKRLNANQRREFPRDVQIDGEAAGTIPDAILEWVAMEALKLRIGSSPPITSISLPGGGSQTFAWPKVSHLEQIQKGLLRRYQENIALLTPAGSWGRREDRF